MSRLRDEVQRGRERLFHASWSVTLHAADQDGLLEMILEGRMSRLVLTHKDRLLHFGAELVFTLCELQGIEVVVIHQGEQPSFEEELAQDVLEIVTVFSARLYGSRSRKHRQLMDTLVQTLPAQAQAEGRT